MLKQRQTGVKTEANWC